MKCDKGSDAWNNLRISHIHVFLQNLGQRVPRKINMEFAKVRRKNFFGEDGVFQMKEFRTTLISCTFVTEISSFCLWIRHSSSIVQSLKLEGIQKFLSKKGEIYRWLTCLKIFYGLYHGIHHHFSPFGGSIFGSVFQVRIELTQIQVGWNLPNLIIQLYKPL